MSLQDGVCRHVSDIWKANAMCGKHRTVNFRTENLLIWSLGQTNSYIKEVGFLSAPTNFLARWFRNFDSKTIGLTILSMTNGRISGRPSPGGTARQLWCIKSYDTSDMIMIHSLMIIPHYHTTYDAQRSSLGRLSEAVRGYIYIYIYKYIYVYIYIHTYIYIYIHTYV